MGPLAWGPSHAILRLRQGDGTRVGNTGNSLTMSSTFEKNLFAGSGKDLPSLLAAAMKAAEAQRGEIEVLRLTASDLQLKVRAPESSVGDALVSSLVSIGFEEPQQPVALWQEAPDAGVAPSGFYSTTHHDTEVFEAGSWQPLQKQRMDACVTNRSGVLSCTKLRDLIGGESVLVGEEGVRLITGEKSEPSHAFAFMANEVSSERRVEIQARSVADLARAARKAGQKVVWVVGPVVVHTGASQDLAQLANSGWIDAVLSGNALAVHDIEAQLHGTSLGISISDGSVVKHGHAHHMRAINRIRAEGSIEAAVASGVLEGGLMHALVKNQVPFVLAGSIRDDGPLPDTEMDLIAAQELYADQLQDAGLVIVLASMLHGIGVGNMLPARVPLVCVDIHPAVVTKLADRGSAQTLGIVTDVGLFVRRLREELVD